MPSSTRFCLVRHGETTWNVDRRIQGQLDIPLNDHGLLQAHATAQALEDVRIDAIYSSDLARAWVTAGRIAVPRGQPVMPEPALRERHYGSFQGMTYAQARARHPADFDRFEAREPDACFPSGSGESLAMLDARIWSLMESLRARHAGQTLLLVTHGGVLDIVARRVRRIGLTGPRDFDIANCALNWVAHGENDWRVERWGDVAHLELTLDELSA